jgi:glutamine cyclotransferase
MKQSKADIVREYGPFPGADRVHGVTYDGQNVWFASGEKLNAFDPASGKAVRSLDVAADAGTAFDGEHIFQLAEDRIQKIDPQSGRVLATIPAPGGGGDSGLTWAEGTLWVGHDRGRKIRQINPETGAILRTIESNRFVTGPGSMGNSGNAMRKMKADSLADLVNMAARLHLAPNPAG